MKRIMRLALCSVLVLILILWAAPALAVPPIPHAFYGTVTINGTDAPIGTVVSAKINGEDAGSYTTTVVGHYGSLAERDYLAVSCDNANDGDTITFFVRGILTDTDTFSAGGGPSEKNLALVITDDSTTGEVDETIPPGQTDVVVDASDIADTTITVDTLAGQGEVTVTVKKYYSNPHPTVTLPASMLPRYIDIEVDNPDAIDWPMYVEQTYTDADVAGKVESSLGMYYFKDGAWHRCSDTGVNTAANYIWANMTEDELSGSPVAMGGTAAPAPAGGGGGGGGAPALPPGTISLAGLIDYHGVFTETVTALSSDSLCQLMIDKGTTGLTKEGEPLSEIKMTRMVPRPAPSEHAHIIGLVYNLEPDGATFSPAITLEYTYDPADIPEGVAEGDLVVAYYDEAASAWVELPSTVDPVTHTITALVSHFTAFTALAFTRPAAFTTTDLSISPTEVDINEDVTISISITNTGTAAGSYKVTLKIDGAVEATKEVTLDAGASKEVSFATSRDKAATYSVDINGLKGSFTVKEEVAPAPPPPPPAPPPEVKPPINWPVVGGIIAGVIVVGLLIFFLARRRAY